MTQQTKTKVVYRGMSGLTLLGILLVIFKLAGIIDISWLWALAPFWIGYAILFGAIALGAVVVGIVFAGAWLIDRLNGR